MAKPSEWEVLVKDDILSWDENKGKWNQIELGDAAFRDDDEVREECTFEISIIRKGNKGGHESWGWADEDKIILDGPGATEPWSREKLDWWIKIASIMAEALNKEGM
jgi:hypothetical protein